MAHPCKHVVSKETSYISLNDSLAAMQVNHYTVGGGLASQFQTYVIRALARTGEL